MTLPTVQISKQGGVVLLAFFAVLFIGGAGALISVLDYNSRNRNRDLETRVALREAKESLVAYAAMYAINYNPTNATTTGPGYLPCPDTNGNGTENAPCAADSLGRLPRSITLPSGAIHFLSNYKADIDEQFWYAVEANFGRSPLGVLNSQTTSSLTLNGQGRVAAVLIAPGLANQSQTRPSNTSNRYLEDSNTAVPNFVSMTTVNPDLFNDQVLAITIDEIMAPVTRQVANLLKTQLDVFHVAQSRYPANQAEFDAQIAPTNPWFVANAWQVNSLYTRIDDDNAVLTFTGCPNISYTVEFNPPNTPNQLRRIGLRC